MKNPFHPAQSILKTLVVAGDRGRRGKPTGEQKMTI
jgi:hypothetical protein